MSFVRVHAPKGDETFHHPNRRGLPHRVTLGTFRFRVTGHHWKPFANRANRTDYRATGGTPQRPFDGQATTESHRAPIAERPPTEHREAPFAHYLALQRASRLPGRATTTGRGQGFHGAANTVCPGRTFRRRDHNPSGHTHRNRLPSSQRHRSNTTRQPSVARSQAKPLLNVTGKCSPTGRLANGPGRPGYPCYQVTTGTVVHPERPGRLDYLRRGANPGEAFRHPNTAGRLLSSIQEDVHA
jgi:hypothetical protein